jgi:hypothetical protein
MRFCLHGSSMSIGGARQFRYYSGKAGGMPPPVRTGTCFRSDCPSGNVVQPDYLFIAKLFICIHLLSKCMRSVV